jgi:hypothetical protein
MIAETFMFLFAFTILWGIWFYVGPWLTRIVREELALREKEAHRERKE